MLTDVDSNPTDREARNEYLIDLDEAWEGCRDAVEEARNSYEERLESTLASHDRQQATASASRRQALDRAWIAYKRQVADTLTVSLRAEARARYNTAAEEIRQAYEETTTRDRASYIQAVHDARVDYEEALDQSFAKHREAIQEVRKFLEPAEGDGDRGVDQSEPIRMIEAPMVVRPPEETSFEDSFSDVVADGRAEGVLSTMNGSAA